MKLATYQDGSRDGQLIVVSQDLTLAHYATGVAHTLQAVLDDWNFMSPQLEDLFVSLNQGRARHAFAFDATRCMAPLPRIYQWVRQVDKKLTRQHGGDHFVCWGADTPTTGIELAYLTADAPANATQAQLRDSLRLAVNIGVTDSNERIQFAPVATTLDALDSKAIG
ncbi:MAG: hypothetical protein QM533_12575 [Cytophagales bacterium]|nr:hypothetical protein [Cytophagales bacterium]